MLILTPSTPHLTHFYRHYTTTTQDFCEKNCGWSALDDGDVEIHDAEGALDRHMKSLCKLVKPADFADIKSAKPSGAGKAAAAAKGTKKTAIKSAKATKAAKPAAAAKKVAVKSAKKTVKKAVSKKGIAKK